MGALRLLPHRCAAGRRGWVLGAVWRTARQLALLRTSACFPGSDGVAAFPGGAGSGVSVQQTSTEQGLSACGLHLTASCPPGCVWL
ncbi:hypothetical protein, partial [Pectobacterium aquaticum]|uniref:hypothetical protein n=1 Tax=Pectobacterium aquaticum TaxID=2204145 RepID=UPI001D028669